MTSSVQAFAESERAAVYRAIFERRDCRRFRPDPIPAATVIRILQAAHHAPSVGFMQPWDFIIINDPGIREQVQAAFVRANTEAANQFHGERRDLYSSLKLQGIRESAFNICVTCNRDRFGPVVLGRTCQPDMDLFSTVCAVQNLWLAARTEGVGVGWVSIIHADELGQILCLPHGVVPVAYLCMGYVEDFPEQPELLTAGWLPRVPLIQMLSYDRWHGAPGHDWQDFHEAARLLAEAEFGREDVRAS